ncbi:molecular chaperone [Desulfopila sp. IMCC35008]|uniref:TorD/DmsD family molecular chaperone n=1 Tax=Desulfopila sp. IMCC35008 TaxID=2653858 RepID=UPI0013D7C488|nr:molecular chaperone TorD family protein [Desulfopila sp. IMCC35008]
MDNVKLLESFRDFFHYGKKEHLQQAYGTMTAASGIERNLQEVDWDMEEFTFNKLFVGPMSPLAPAVASIYLDREGLIQGDVTDEIRTFYASIGLSLASVGSEPEDSLAYELDACRHLLFLAREVPEAKAALNSFINEHLSLWIPEFTTRAMEHCTDSVVVSDVLKMLSEWVESENGKIMQHKEKE